MRVVTAKAKDRMDVFGLLRREASEADLDYRREEIHWHLHRPQLRRGAGRSWTLRIVESDDLREVGVVQGVRTGRHLLRPFDVLVTACSGVLGVDARVSKSSVAIASCP